MNVLIVGCRRVGATLANMLDAFGHDVSVLAQKEEDLQLLEHFGARPFGGMAFSGVVLDMDNLRTAGIQNVDAVACVTDDDSINIMVAQMARELFGIANVICRVADPSTKDAYQRHYNLPVVSPTNLVAESVYRAVLGKALASQLTFGSDTAGFTVAPVEEPMLGALPGDVPPPQGGMLFGVLYGGETLRLANKACDALKAEDKLVWAEIID